MKTLIHLFIIISISNVANSQNLLVANNNAGAAAGTNVYTGINALENAITAATAGDIIYVVPSSVKYGSNDINITKSLTIFGVGLRPTKDVSLKSVIDVNCFQCAIEVNASNVRLSGLIIDGEVNLNWNDTQDQTGIIIENSKMERVIMKTTSTFQISNLLIRNNVIIGSGSIATHILLKDAPSALITNNIMTEGNISSQPMIQANGATFKYNVFSDTGTSGSSTFASVISCLFDHNIFYGVRVDVAGTFSSNTWNYNLCYGNTTESYHVFDTSNGSIVLGNIESTIATPMDPTFTFFPLTSSWDDSYDLTLLVGSPAINVNGKNIGPSGGSTPFDAEGNLLPLIQSVTIPAVIPVGSDLPVTIKAKGN